MNSPLRLLLYIVLVASILPFSLRAEVKVEVLANCRPAPQGANPYGHLLEASDGNFYGTTFSGGDYGKGTIFRLTPAGQWTKLYSFQGPDGDGPFECLIQGRDGNLYGTTSDGGTTDVGTVFKMTLDGKLTTLASFTGNNGVYPNALVEDADGNFYGTTSFGGITYMGTFFKLTPAGKITTLLTFNAVNGAHPCSGLILGQDGNFYGTTGNGGAGGHDVLNPGTIFKVTRSGKLTTLASFYGTGMMFPRAGLIQGTDGNFYGTTSRGGTTDDGAIFRMTPKGTLTLLASLNGSNGAQPLTSLLQASDGNFYGTAFTGGANDVGALYRITPAGAISLIYSFTGQGGLPRGSLIQGKDGYLYGASTGGDLNIGTTGVDGVGTVFRLSLQGAMKTLFTFDSTPCAQPYKIIQAKDGAFYGISRTGGTSNAGTVFKMAPDGSLTTLASFNRENGRTPTSLLQARDGNFYGTTRDGGPNDLGVIFKLDADNQLTAFATFNGNDGVSPSSLVQARNGNFYGSTDYNFTDPSSTIFRVTPAGKIIVLGTLDQFKPIPQPDQQPIRVTTSGVILARDGNLYGLASADLGSGAILYRCDLSGAMKALFSFDNVAGRQPLSLLQGKDGDLHGVYFSDELQAEALFRINLAGEATKVPFQDPFGIALPLVSIIEGKDGQFYGNSDGRVLQLTPDGEVTLIGSVPGRETTEKFTWYTDLMEAADGNLYGTAPFGGPLGRGGIYEVNRLAAREQVITFPPVVGAGVGQRIILQAQASSGLPIAYKYISGPAVISGNEARLTGLGPVVISANQAGNLNFLPAAEVRTSFSVGKGPQTITLPPVGNQALGSGPITLKGTATSGLPVTYKVTGPATVLGNQLTITGAGAVQVGAYQSGNELYTAAPVARASFVVNKLAQKLTFPAVGVVPVGKVITLEASTTSGLPVTYSGTGPVALVGNQATFTGAGSVKLTANQGGDATYAKAPPVSVNVTVR